MSACGWRTSWWGDRGFPTRRLRHRVLIHSPGPPSIGKPTTVLCHHETTDLREPLDAATSGLARMNMILHDNATASIERGNTLTSPRFMDGESLRA